MGDIRHSFVDDYEHLDDSIEYILENVLQDRDGSDEFQRLEDDFQSTLLSSCRCDETCANDDCIHGRNYEIKNNNRLLLREERGCGDLIYECNESCRCSRSLQTCRNRLVQFGPAGGLKIRKLDDKGYGLFSEMFLAKGTFICEYAGEILTKAEAHRRDESNEQNNLMNYIFCLNEMSSQGGNAKIQTFIDPSRKGNIGRYINHSCDPNCEILSVRVDSIIPKIAIFAKRDISAGEELTFSYGGVNEESNKKKLCHCKTSNCQFYLPNISFN